MTSTPATSKANGTEYNFEGQTSSADQEQVSTQKYIKVTKEQPGDRKARTQVVLDRLREFVCKAEGDQTLPPELQEAVHSEVAKLIVALQKIDNLLIHKSSRQQTKRIKLKSLVEDVEIALNALDQSKPKVELAKTIRVSIERIINRYQYRCFPLGLIVNRFQDAYESESTPLKVLCGLSIASLFNLLLMGSTVVLLQRQTNLETSTANRALKGQIAAQDRIAATANQEITKLLGSQNLQPNRDRLNVLEETQRQAQAESRLLNRQLTAVNPDQTSEDQRSKNIRHIRAILLVITAGTLGSIISILIRIEDFQDKKYWNRATPFLIGAFKPIIGASFAIFFFTLISSELIQIPGINTDFEVGSKSLSSEQRQVLSQIDLVDESKEEFFIFAIAFLVGFSERLATDAISKMEDMMGGSAEGKGKNDKDNEAKPE
jgi:hypothetical protein